MRHIRAGVWQISEMFWDKQIELAPVTLLLGNLAMSTVVWTDVHALMSPTHTWPCGDFNQYVHYK